MHQQVPHIQRHSCWSTKRIINRCTPQCPFNFSPSSFRRPSIKHFPCLRKTQPDLYRPALRPRFLFNLHHQEYQFNRIYHHIEGRSQYRQRSLLHGLPKRQSITCLTHTSALPILKQCQTLLKVRGHCLRMGSAEVWVRQVID